MLDEGPGRDYLMDGWAASARVRQSAASQLRRPISTAASGFTAFDPFPPARRAAPRRPLAAATWFKPAIWNDPASWSLGIAAGLASALLYHAAARG
jgi:hypothetical protein